jgi:phage terminase large subunit-like protein
MTTTTTRLAKRSAKRPAAERAPARPPSRARQLAALKISPEVGAYLEARGIPLPSCCPRVKTPEPRLVKGAVFSFDAVDKVLAAFGMLRHTKGEWAGRPLKPDPWQVAYVLAPVFGWLRPADDGTGYVRVISELYVDVPRKNGKSTLLGGIAVYMLAADGEQGAEVVTAATTKEQAGYVFNPIKTLCEKSPGLAKHVKPYAFKIMHPRSGSYLQVISSAADAQHGANLHAAVIDELHVHKTPDLVEALESGTGSRRQPLIAMITTADDGRQGTIYARKRERVEKLAAQVFTDPTVHGVIFAAEAGDDPHALETMAKANPGMGISPTVAYLRKASTEAQQSPASLSKYLRLHLGLRTKQETRYLTLADWDANAGLVDPTKLVGRRAFGGLDLASTSDLCALAWDFPDDQGGHDVLWRLWLPEEGYADLVKRTAKEAETWRRDGWLTVTPGRVQDYDYIREQVNADRERFKVQEVAYDRWNSSQLVVDLRADGCEMAEMGQGYASMSPPTKELARLLLTGTPDAPTYRHGGNPVVRWMVDNLGVMQDAAGNVKPAKDRSGDKIDGLVAGIMALDRATQAGAERRSAYDDDSGLVVV